jgi:hypothetical protein
MSDSAALSGQNNQQRTRHARAAWPPFARRILTKMQIVPTSLHRNKLALAKPLPHLGEGRDKNEFERKKI